MTKLLPHCYNASYYTQPHHSTEPLRTLLVFSGNTFRWDMDFSRVSSLDNGTYEFYSSLYVYFEHD